MDEKESVRVCTLCNTPLTIKLAEKTVKGGKVYSVYLCRKCDVGITIPFPSQEELAGLYGSGNYRSTGGKRFNPLLETLIGYFRLLRKKRIERYARRGRILDIGCGRGLFLHIMKRGGWDVRGVEYDNEAASSAASAYGISVVTGDPSQWAFDSEHFDVITINHALEHISRPDEMIGECGKLLKGGGLLVIAVPNRGSLQAAAGKGSWLHLDVPYHLYHFSADGLSSLLRKHSFKVFKTRQFDLEYNPFGWLQTLLNLSGIRANLFYNLLKSPELRKDELAHTRVKDLLLTFALLPLYFPLSFLLSAVESFVLKRGGTIEVYAVKNELPVCGEMK